MKNTNHIIESRNEINRCVELITLEIKNLYQNKRFNELSEVVQTNVIKLSQLRKYYQEQIRGINFCLNEDDQLNNHNDNPEFSNFVDKEYFYNIW